jgi:hypothetical protein
MINNAHYLMKASLEPFDQGGYDDANIVACSKTTCSQMKKGIDGNNGTRLYNVITSDVAKMAN